MSENDRRRLVGIAAVGVVILGWRSACLGAIGTTQVSTTGTYTATDAAPDALTTTDTANATLTMQVAGGSANPDCPNDQGMVRITTAGTGVGSATATWSGRSTGWGCTYSVTGVYSGGTGGGGGGGALPAPWSSAFQSQNTPRLALEINRPGTADDVLTWGGTGTATVTLLTAGTDANSYSVTISDMSNPNFVSVSCPNACLSASSPSYMTRIAGCNTGTTTLTATCPTISVSPTRTVTIGQVVIGPVVRTPQLPYSVSPTQTGQVSVQYDPLFASIGAQETFSVVGTGGNNGSASVSPSTLTNSGTLTVTGITQTNSGYSGQLFIQATGCNGTLDGTSPGFSVCAHPVAVQDGPGNGLINSGGVAGMWIQIVIKSDSGTDADLNQVQDTELVSISYNHTGSFLAVPPGSSWNSGYMPAVNVPDDHHTYPVNGPDGILDLCDNHGGNGSSTVNQMDAFYCQRCGMTQASATAIPNSGYHNTFTIIQGTGTQVKFRVDQTRNAVTLMGFSTSSGSAAADYSQTVPVRN